MLGGQLLDYCLVLRWSTFRLSFTGNGVWIGEKVCILPGVHIGEKAIIGAGAVVTKDIQDYCIAVGNPAKAIKKFDFNSNNWIKIPEK